MLADPAVIRASQRFVRIIIRRPHAYIFKRDHREAPIPGFAYLDGDGKVMGTFAPTGKDLAAGFAASMEKAGK